MKGLQVRHGQSFQFPFRPIFLPETSPEDDGVRVRTGSMTSLISSSSSSSQERRHHNDNHQRRSRHQRDAQDCDADNESPLSPTTLFRNNIPSSSHHNSKTNHPNMFKLCLNRTSVASITSMHDKSSCSHRSSSTSLCSSCSCSSCAFRPKNSKFVFYVPFLSERKERQFISSYFLAILHVSFCSIK